MSDNNSAALKAQQLIAEGDKRLTRWSFFSTKNSNKQLAAESYKQAGVQFKIAKMTFKSGEAFEKAGDMYESSEDTHEACACFIEAAKAFSPDLLESY